MNYENNLIKKKSLEFNQYYKTSRPGLIDLCKGLNCKNALDIGCGAGENLKLLKKIYPKCTTTGIEVRKDLTYLLKKNRNCNHFIIDEAYKALKALPCKYDIVIMSHVLEHQNNHDEFLKAAVDKIIQNGHLLIALPNVRHLSVTLPLFFKDSFSYTNCGILDNTHLRFFTKKSAFEMLNSHNLRIEKWKPDFYKGKCNLINAISGNIFYKHLAFAYNILCKKSIIH